MVTYPIPTPMTTVWLIEDNAPFRSNLAELVGTMEGVRCGKTFPRCEQAIEALQSNELPDIIIMDIGLPGIDGIEGARRIRQIVPAIKIVMLTIFDDNERIFHAICAGADGYLLKSTPPEKLLELLNDIIMGGAPMNPQIARKVLDLLSHRLTSGTEYQLTAREKEILRLLIDDFPKKQIADRLSLSFHTIDTHMRNIYEKLHVHSRSAAVAKALRERLI
jgi:DNA-binding NarL/FixJ family response regulator